jgi:Virulence-associated protein E
MNIQIVKQQLERPVVKTSKVDAVHSSQKDAVNAENSVDNSNNNLDIQTEKLSTNNLVEETFKESKGQTDNKSNAPHSSILPTSVEAEKGALDSPPLGQVTKAKINKINQVADFLDQFKAPELKEISLEQTQGFVEQILEPRLEYNLLTQDVELDGESLRRHQNETLDVVNRTLVLCEKEYQVKFQKDKAFKNHLMDALSRNTYHPVEKYLKDLDLTNQVSIDNLAERYLGNKDKLANILLKKTLIAAVARVLKPGCAVHAILILYSPQQGIGKSSFLRTLAKNPAWFNDTVPEIKLNKDFYSKLHQYWFTEIGEIDTKFRRIKQEEIKDFITSSTDAFRPAYTATMLKCDRRFVLTGTANNGSFLTDQTGSRRYWIVPVNGKIDISCLEKEVDQIWAAAVNAYNNGEQWHLNEEEAKMLEKSNASFTYESPWHQTIKRYLDRHKIDEYILPENIAAIPALDISKREINKPNSKALKEIRNLLQQNFGYSSKKISNQQRETLFNKLKNDSRCQPQVLDISEIPHSIWVKSDDYFGEQRQPDEDKAA